MTKTSERIRNYIRVIVLVVVVGILVAMFANSMGSRDRERQARIDLCIEHGYLPVYAGFNARFTGTCIRYVDGNSEVIKASDLE